MHREGSKNPADGPSRRADFVREAGDEDQIKLGERYPMLMRKTLGLQGGATDQEVKATCRLILSRGTGARKETTALVAATRATGNKQQFAPDPSQEVLAKVPEYLQQDEFGQQILAELREGGQAGW